MRCSYCGKDGCLRTVKNSNDNLKACCEKCYKEKNKNETKVYTSLVFKS